MGLEPLDYHGVADAAGFNMLEPLSNYLENQTLTPEEKAQWDAEWSNGGAEYFDKVLTAAVKFERCDATAWRFRQKTMCPTEAEMPSYSRPIWMNSWVEDRMYEIKGRQKKFATQERRALRIHPEFERIKQLREKTGADIVVIMGSFNRYSYALMGTAGYTFPNWGLIYIPLPSLIVNGDEDALMHEMGHILGLDHGVRGAKRLTYARGPYVFGSEVKLSEGCSRFPLADFMSYGTSADGSCVVSQLAGVVSNPDIKYAGITFGSNEPLPPNSILYAPGVRDESKPADYEVIPSNEARAMNEVRFAVSGYRPRKTEKEISLDFPYGKDFFSGIAWWRKQELLNLDKRYQVQGERITAGGVCRFPAINEENERILFAYQLDQFRAEIETAKNKCIADLAAYKKTAEAEIMAETDSIKKQALKSKYKRIVLATENEMWGQTFKFYVGIVNSDKFVQAGLSPYSDATPEPKKVYIPSTGIPMTIKKIRYNYPSDRDDIVEYKGEEKYLSLMARDINFPFYNISPPSIAFDFWTNKFTSTAPAFSAGR